MILKLNSKKEYVVTNFGNAIISEIEITTMNSLCFKIGYIQKECPKLLSLTFFIPFWGKDLTPKDMELGRKIADCIMEISFNKVIPNLTLEIKWEEKFKDIDWITIYDNQIIIDIPE